MCHRPSPPSVQGLGSSASALQFGAHMFWEKDSGRRGGLQVQIQKGDSKSSKGPKLLQVN